MEVCVYREEVGMREELGIAVGRVDGERDGRGGEGDGELRGEGRRERRRANEPFRGVLSLETSSLME